MYSPIVKPSSVVLSFDCINPVAGGAGGGGGTYPRHFAGTVAPQDLVNILRRCIKFTSLLLQYEMV